jgi:signal transduction histidine kinase
MTRDLVDRLHRRIEEKDLAVTVALDYTGERPVLDEQLVSRALGELVDNAVRLTPQGGRVAVGTQAANGGVRWWIEDSGPGIPPDDLPRLFEPFYRVDPARTRDSGTGLGLTLAASLARVHGGTIRAENVPAGGARFEVEFPVG